MVISNHKLAASSLLAMLMPIAGMPSLAHAKGGRDRWAHPIPVPKSAANSPRLRQALQRWDREQLRNARECGRDLQQFRPELKFNKNSDLPYDNQYRVIFSSSKLYSVAVTTDFFCGGSYPVMEEVVLNLEVKSGRIFDPLKLYKIGKQTGEGIRLLPEIKQMILRSLIRKSRVEAKDSGCLKILRRDGVGYMNFTSVGLTKSGLYVAMDAPHVSAACYPPVLLAHKQIRKYLQREVAVRVGWPLR